MRSPGHQPQTDGRRHRHDTALAATACPRTRSTERQRLFPAVRPGSPVGAFARSWLAPCLVRLGQVLLSSVVFSLGSLFVHFELPFAHHIAKLRFFLTTFSSSAFLTLRLGVLAGLRACFSTVNLPDLGTLKTGDANAWDEAFNWVWPAV